MNVSRREVILGAGGVAGLLLAQAAPASATPGPPPVPGQLTTSVRSRLTKALVPLVQPYDIGVSLLDRRSGKYWRYRSTKSYNLASVTKVITAASAYLASYKRGRALTATELGWIKAALRYSDNNAQSALWAMSGYWSGYDGTARAFGLSSGTKPAWGYGWGRSWSTPDDQVLLENMLLTHTGPLRDADFANINYQMSQVSSSQTWGVAPFGRSATRTIRVKDGWVPLPDNGRWRINSMGQVVDPAHNYALAILSNGWSTMSAGVARVNPIGYAVYNTLWAGPLV